MATALLGDLGREQGRHRNLLWRHFTGLPSRIVSAPQQDAAFESAAVADLRAATGRYPTDSHLRG